MSFDLNSFFANLVNPSNIQSFFVNAADAMSKTDQPLGFTSRAGGPCGLDSVCTLNIVPSTTSTSNSSATSSSTASTASSTPSSSSTSVSSGTTPATTAGVALTNSAQNHGGNSFYRR